MSKLALSLAGVALLAASASADLVLGTFDTPAADSAAVKKVYSADAFSNTASKRGLVVGADGALTLTVTLAADAGKDYSANAGILVPLNNLWAPMDIRTATAVSFRIKGSGAYNVNFALGSDVYPNADDGVVMVAPVKVTTAWAAKSIALQPTPALAWLSWMEDEVRFPGGTAASIIMNPTDPNYGDDTKNVAMAIKQVQFNIDPTWKTATTWTAPVAGATTLSVDDIVMVGMEKYPAVLGVGCAAGLPSAVFSSNKEPMNAAGGYWYAFTDTGAAGLAKGTSSIVLPAEWKKWKVDTAMAAVKLVANLTRAATNLYAGFADVGSNSPDETYLDLTGLASIGFALALPEGATLDKDAVGGVHFKVGKLSVGDSATHEVVIPASQVIAGTDICVDIKMLKMPGWMLTKPDFKLFSPEDVNKFNWEVKLEDQTGKVNSALAQGFMVGPITFYGLAAIPDATPLDPTSVKGRVARASFSASYANSILSVKGLEGYKTVDVMSLSGARVASFKAGSATKIRLDRGAYMLVARGEGKKTLSRTLAVAK